VIARALPFLLGVIFSVGLALAGMTQPEKIVGFLNVSGAWDPSLAFVMGGAVMVAALAFRLAARVGRPALGGSFPIATRTRLDRRLIAGSALFGIGWGLGGYCPGPAITALGAGSLPAAAFVATMVLAMWATRTVEQRVLSVDLSTTSTRSVS
jgi:uncharacterized membrane protein YedE/YeeE